MKRIKIDLTKGYEDIKESILDYIDYPEEIEKLKEMLQSKLSEEEYLDAEILLNEGLCKVDELRFDLGYNVKKAKELGMSEYIVEF